MVFNTPIFLLGKINVHWYLAYPEFRESQLRHSAGFSPASQQRF